MNKIFSTILTISAIWLLGACASENDLPAPEQALREIEVNIDNGPLSRTTIEYENVDVSHLVWSDGDRVAYVTDYPGDVCRVATVTDNSFTVQVPQGASSANKLIVVWPVGDNEGKPLNQMSAVISNTLEQNLDQQFDGRLLPMMSTVNVPSGNTVDASFEFLASVIRLTINPYLHESEQLKQVKLSASQSLAGSYSFSANGAAFTPGAKSIECTVSGEEMELQRLYENNKYIYLVVNRDQYTDATLDIITDTDKYRFPGGTFNVAKPGVTLYRLAFTIEHYEPVPDPVYRYKQITSLDELTTNDGDKYLIVCKSMGVIFGSHNSNNYPEGISCPITYQGYIDPASDNVEKMAAVLAPNPTNPGDYSINIAGFRSGYPWIGCMPNYTKGDHGRIYADKSNQFDSKLDYWTITFDDEGNVILGAHPNSTDGGPWQMAYSYDKGYFCCRESTTTGMLDIQLFKYQLVE